MLKFAEAYQKASGSERNLYVVGAKAFEDGIYPISTAFNGVNQQLRLVGKAIFKRFAALLHL